MTEPSVGELLIGRIARLTYLDTTDKEWQSFPTTAQAKVQAKYTRLARKVVEIVEKQWDL